jgi:aerotaxis receptor
MTDRKQFPPSQKLVSTTDLNSYITYANPAFVQISGYAEHELLGSPHNLVRHPDMPKEAFKALWDTVHQGKPWMGIVKNKCKDGNYYWVDAYVTPVFEAGRIIGYQSVRTHPEQEYVDNAESLYAQIRRGASLRMAPLLSWRNSVLTMQAAGAAAILLATLFAGSLGSAVGALLALLALGGSWMLLGKMNHVLAIARNISDDPLARRVYTGRTDELGTLELALKATRSQITTILKRVDESASRLDGLAAQANRAVGETDAAINRQQAELASVSSAVTEMSSAIQEVSSNTSNTSTAAELADRSVSEGYQSIAESLNATTQLAGNIDDITSMITALGDNSAAIGSVIEVINGIAEQTNLLALNAAIEAARAGDQGRGFAVVADEVRTLAQRTQNSTVQIKEIITRIQGSTQSCVASIASAQEKAQRCVHFNQEAGAAYNSISKAVSDIRNMTFQVASAVEEQSAVAEEVNRNIVNIQTQSELTSEASSLTSNASARLASDIAAMQELVRQFAT